MPKNTIKKTLIIGAGPVGSYAASLLAKNQHFDSEISLFEEHSSVGVPVHCTGIVTPEIFNFVPKKNDFVINKIHDVRIISPNKSFLKLRLKKPDLILDRVAFDKYFFNLALDAGVIPKFKHRFISCTKNSAEIKDLLSGKRKNIPFNYLIGADGPNSAVGRSTGLIKNREFFIGIQAVVKKKNDNVLDFYPLDKGFAWSVPVDSNTLRIGVASKYTPGAEFHSILKKYGGRVIEKQGGLIPVYNHKADYNKKNIFLVGDAAGFVKATTGGGLIPGLSSAESIVRSLSKKSNYRSNLSSVRKSLNLNLKARNIMDSFLEKEWDELIYDLDSKKTKSIFENINRDEFAKLAFILLLKKPSLVKYGFRHFKKLFF
jgi:flavin-dependent dehydrogenase